MSISVVKGYLNEKDTEFGQMNGSKGERDNITIKNENDNNNNNNSKESAQTYDYYHNPSDNTACSYTIKRITPSSSSSLQSSPSLPIQFQICQSCFWCASSFSQLIVFDRCPACQKEYTVESMPVATDELLLL
jgi:hypothetical protein